MWIGAVFAFERVSHEHAEGAVQLALTYMSGAGMHAGTAPVATAAASAPSAPAVVPCGLDLTAAPADDTYAVSHVMHAAVTAPVVAAVVSPAHPERHPSTPGQPQDPTEVVASEGYVPECSGTAPEGSGAVQHSGVHVGPIVAHAPTPAPVLASAVPQPPVIGGVSHSPGE